MKTKVFQLDISSVSIGKSSRDVAAFYFGTFLVIIGILLIDFGINWMISSICTFPLAILLCYLAVTSKPCIEIIMNNKDIFYLTNNNQELKTVFQKIKSSITKTES